MYQRASAHMASLRSGVPPTYIAGGVAAWFVVVDNITFWRTFLGAQTTSILSIGAAIALALALWTVATAVLRALGPPRFARIGWAVLLLVSAFAAHFVDSWGILLDRGMMENVFQTDTAEARDLLTVPLILDVLLRGVLPAVLILALPLKSETLWSSWCSSVALGGLAVMTVAAALIAFYSIYAPTFRNHRELRLQLVPSNYISSTLSILRPPRVAPIVPMGVDATRPAATDKRPLLVVLVVGETARADNFSLSGYGRPTNDALDGTPIVYFPNVTSCGTDTATSLPCMFSGLGREKYTTLADVPRENLLDVLQRTGVRVTWIDNNSGCKRVCDRVETIKLRDDRCESEGECFDEALLGALKRELDKPASDALVVLHQQGSHGPAYFKRYPQPPRFAPTCETSRLQDCTRESIVNTYDNTIDYTSRVLSQAIELLEKDASDRDILFVYISDHGESLGERGVFLHGMPRWIAPHEQSHVPMLVWMDEATQQRLAPDMVCLLATTQQPLSHDNLFHTLLGAFDVTTSLYSVELDVFAPARGSAECPAASSAQLHPVSLRSTTVGRPHIDHDII